MPEADEPQYRLSIVAEIVQIHPDTIRRYERQGLIRSQQRDGERLFSERTLARIRRITSITKLGVNLSGADVVCNLLERLEDLQAENQALRAQILHLLEE
jgi:MerR family transcriptional regulator/heat shock protein HspR